MSITIERDSGVQQHAEEAFSLECPYCGLHAHMALQSGPDFATLQRNRPEQVGLVYECDACAAPVFLRYNVRNYSDDSIELHRNYTELERPRERYSFTYLPQPVEVLFREALECYANHTFNAFASMCRRAARAAFAAMGESGKLHAFDEVMAAQDIAEIDDESFAPIKSVIFDVGEEDDLPLLNHAQAGVLLEVMKDMLYQCFVRRGKLARAIKVRRFFVKDGNGGSQASA